MKNSSITTHKRPQGLVVTAPATKLHDTTSLLTHEGQDHRISNRRDSQQQAAGSVNPCVLHVFQDQLPIANVIFGKLDKSKCAFLLPEGRCHA